MKRRYKFLLLLAGWWFAALFAVPQINRLMPIKNQLQIWGVLEALLFLACVHGSLIWLIWPPKTQTETLPRQAIK